MDILSKSPPTPAPKPQNTQHRGGPDCPPTKRMIAQTRADEERLRQAARTKATASSPSSSSNEGYMAYMQRQIQERTEKLNIMGDSMENLESNSSGWADDVSKFVNKQKRGAVTGCEYLLDVEEGGKGKG